MKIEIHIHHYDADGEILRRLDSLERNIMSALSDLQAAVAAQTGAVDSAILLIKGFKAALDKAGTDPAALRALSTELGGKTQELAEAVVANPLPTDPPADPPPPDNPPPLDPPAEPPVP